MLNPFSYLFLLLFKSPENKFTDLLWGLAAYFRTSLSLKLKLPVRIVLNYRSLTTLLFYYGVCEAFGAMLDLFWWIYWVALARSPNVYWLPIING